MPNVISPTLNFIIFIRFKGFPNLTVILNEFLTLLSGNADELYWVWPILNLSTATHLQRMKKNIPGLYIILIDHFIFLFILLIWIFF